MGFAKGNKKEKAILTLIKFFSFFFVAEAQARWQMEMGKKGIMRNPGKKKLHFIVFGGFSDAFRTEDRKTQSGK